METLEETGKACARVPQPVRDLAGAFSEAGYGFYLVGGYTRDVLSGGEPKDIDATTGAHPKRIREILADAGGRNFWEAGMKFGTVGAEVGGLQIEITTFRAEAYTHGSRKPQTRYGASLAQDLDRRDFTVNAIALDPLTGRMRDPHGGRADLASGILCCVGTRERGSGRIRCGCCAPCASRRLSD